ncbi:MAG: tRNA (adenosine(37)-N6)-threonylcarbamoyltransferase complex dimerization subunit type 1 TsaB [Bacteroidales bacterium]
MQPFLLLLETSTAVCSVSLAQGTDIIACRQSAAPKAHASLLAVFIDEVLKEHHLTLRDCQAVAVSGGPGSYTGLRVGVSTAKGLCFASSLPLIAVSSLELIAQLTVDNHPGERPYRIFPMIDARRMEVYTAPYSVTDSEDLGRLVKREGQVVATVVTGESFKESLDAGQVVFSGDGAFKCRDVIKHPNARFISVSSHADGMAKAALKAFREQKFEDVAYYTPFYLKEFRAIRPKTGF